MEQVLNELLTGKAHGLSDVSLELIAASSEGCVQVMVELCQKFLDLLGMPAECALSMVVPILRGKGDIRNRTCYKTMNFLSMK